MLEYFYTKYGDVYAGYEVQEANYPDYTVVIQGTKIEEYKKLKPEEKTLEKISEYGWVLGNNVIYGTVNSADFKPEINHINFDYFDSAFERKYMFIFGAGASANCVFGNEKSAFEKDNLRPPIGTELFEKRFKDYYSKYKGVKQSLYFLQNEKEQNIEELFENEWKNIQKDNNQEVLSRHINIQYYLQELLMNVSERVINEYESKNLYAVLADKLQKKYASSFKSIDGSTTSKKFAFVSFNQDTILEYFVSEYFKKPLQKIEDYVQVNDSPFCIFKPHGSWNWGWKFPDISRFEGNTSSWLYENNINFCRIFFELLGDYKNMTDWNSWGIEARISKHGLGKHTIDKSKLELIKDNKCSEFYPALLLPHRDKDEFSMPIKHLLNLTSYLHNIETVIIIGWKGNEEAFNRLLFKEGRKINKVIIVDPNPEIVKENLKPLLARLNKNNIKHYADFENFVLNGLDIEIE
ncbi:MAG: hypothetical protein A2046_02515 [Bacteroidetes bacterium GWA2_30_7]|nr:MAG: hypothetical protein A2046_02515 [Bacteroidetes bacterium GWA2_30_7]